MGFSGEYGRIPVRCSEEWIRFLNYSVWITRSKVQVGGFLHDMVATTSIVEKGRKKIPRAQGRGIAGLALREMGSPFIQVSTLV